VLPAKEYYAHSSLLLSNTRLCVLPVCLQAPSSSERDPPPPLEAKADAVAVTVTLLAACTGSPGLSPPSDRPNERQGDTRAILSDQLTLPRVRMISKVSGSTYVGKHAILRH
jgi:hypothetical protein